MKIINFVKHPEPIAIGGEHNGSELASFDLEFQCGDIILVWQGWSVRQFKDYPPVLQAAHMDRRTTRSKGTCVLIKGIDPSVLLKELREQIKEQHGIEVPTPKKQIPMTEAKQVPASTSACPASPPETALKPIQTRIDEIKVAMKKNLAQIKNKRQNSGS